MKNKRNIKENGITLIALVVTIIVLLILAAISISLVLGQNGLISRASEARGVSERGNEKELIQMEVLGSYNKNGILEIGTVNSNIKNNISGVKTDDSADFPLKVTYTSTNNSYTVLRDGTVTMIAPKTNNTLASKITPTNYGDFVRHSVDLNDDGDTTNDWRIFYENNDGNVFLIAASNMLSSKLPNNLGLSINNDYPYGVFWTSTDNYTKGTSDINMETARRFMFTYSGDYEDDEEYEEYVNSSSSLKAAASFLDTNSWSYLTTGINGAQAIATPTIEMFIESWNAKGYPHMYYDAYDPFYDLVDEEGNHRFYGTFEDGGLEGYNDNLYFNDDTSFAGGAYTDTWLIAPYSDGMLLFYETYSSGVAFIGSQNYPVVDASPGSKYGIRPIICLPADISGEQDSNRIWNLE